VHDESIDCPVVFTQEFCQEKNDEQPVAPFGGFDVLEDTVQKPYDGAKQGQYVFEALKGHIGAHIPSTIAMQEGGGVSSVSFAQKTGL
jgi:hypothetical protein